MMSPFTQAQAKDMVKKERDRTQFWYYNDEKQCRVNRSAEIKEEQTAATLKVWNSGTGKKKFVFMELPFKIRAQILEELLSRPLGIVPGEVRHKVKIDKNFWAPVTVYSYQWNGHRQEGYSEHKLPRYDGSSQRLQTSWLSTPSKMQLHLIEKGLFNQNYKYDPITGGFSSQTVIQKNDSEIKIRTRAEVVTTGIQPNILRTCQALHKEGCSILYGQNLFVFDTSQKFPYTPRGSFDRCDKHLVPRFLEGFGEPLTQQETEVAIGMMFDQESEQQSFVRRDPLANFLSKIGRKNGALIANIELDGAFRTVDPYFKHYQHVRFARILRMYTSILKNICVNLRKLVIHQVENGTNEGKNFLAMVYLVDSLPNLRELQLGSDELIGTATLPLQWGQALVCERYVAMRLALKEQETLPMMLDVDDEV
ncbi:hypothetical protein EG329_013298 [Mollisiaceae sp. DMI_Dod_QoI]|nr:hypothetical protein EG329_013298 [Helotiales sp. DMI_Dod_QoI]